MPDNNSIKHLAIIMDGNGRWAQSRGQKRIDGHVRGAEVASDIVESCVRRGIPVLTLYALSVENLQRDPAEVAFITNLVVKTLTRKQESLIENGVRVKIIGDMNHFDDKVQSFREGLTLNSDRAVSQVGVWRSGGLASVWMENMIGRLGEMLDQ